MKTPSRKEQAGRARRGSLGSALCALLLFGAAVAPLPSLADAYYVQTTGIELRAEAEALLDQVREAGIEAEIVRHFRRGRGWEFLVRTTSTEDKDEAHQRAVQLSALSGQSARVFVVAGRDALQVDELSVMVSGPGDAGGGAPDGDDTSDDGLAERGAALLSAVVLAHGGHPTAGTAERGADRVSWQQFHCRYERRLSTAQGELRVGHEIWRSGAAIRLDVRILEGEGKGSSAIVKGLEQAWLQVDGELHEVAPGPTREGLMAFAPESVLQQALAIRTWTPDSPAVGVGGPAGGDDLVWMEMDLSDDGKGLLVGVDPGDHRVRELIVRGGDEEARWRFADYQELEGGVIVPLKTEVLSNGEIRERIVVRLLELGIPIDPGVFEPGSLKTTEPY